MLLIGRIGADHAAYVMLLMPVVALIISTFFEEYQWSANAVSGVIVVLVGNLIILTPAETLEK
jgi:drug/metabolite transporter (DMT)-like permease